MDQVLHFRGRGIIQFGLVLLIATPVARVAFSIWGFLAERDRMYAAFTAWCSQSCFIAWWIKLKRRSGRPLRPSSRSTRNSCQAEATSLGNYQHLD